MKKFVRKLRYVKWFSDINLRALSSKLISDPFSQATFIPSKISSPHSVLSVLALFDFCLSELIWMGKGFFNMLKSIERLKVRKLVVHFDRGTDTLYEEIATSFAKMTGYEAVSFSYVGGSALN